MTFNFLPLHIGIIFLNIYFTFCFSQQKTESTKEEPRPPAPATVSKPDKEPTPSTSTGTTAESSRMNIMPIEIYDSEDDFEEPPTKKAHTQRGVLRRCYVCRKYFNDEVMYKAHLKTHNKMCEYCGATIVCPKAYRKHFEICKKKN